MRPSAMRSPGFHPPSSSSKSSSESSSGFEWAHVDSSSTVPNSSNSCSKYQSDGGSPFTPRRSSASNSSKSTISMNPRSNACLTTGLSSTSPSRVTAFCQPSQRKDWPWGSSSEKQD